MAVGDIWVIDTSSVIQIKRIVPTNQRRAVLEKLSGLVESGMLVYPAQVVNELKRYLGSDPLSPDPLYRWARQNQTRATRHGPQSDVLKEILQHPQVRRVFDPDKLGVEEADPYVLALAAHLKREGHDVTVLTEETKNRPDKLSMNTACGLLRLWCLAIEPFLVERSIWAPSR